MCARGCVGRVGRYARLPAVLVLSGLLPFGSIFIEMYFVFASFWAYKVYYVYGFMLLVFAILLTVTACVAVVVAYVRLNAEDHRWCVHAHTCPRLKGREEQRGTDDG
jgi:hypothetical protein